MVSPSRTLLAALVVLGGASAASAAASPAARSCPNPDALGIARTITIGGTPDLGLKTYPQTLDLHDHEVVLTFDDGPWPVTTPAVLAALDAQCVKATFFLIGRNAQAHPELVKREVAAGHTVGHHTWDHPALTLRHLDETAALADIDHGMQADDKAGYDARWTGQPRVPFFRFPGFGDTEPLLADLRRRGIAVFGTDLWASDWIPMTPDAEFDRLMGRLRAAGRGIVLLHDIKTQTADMLPRFLAALKAEDFHVVQIVPGGTSTPTRDAPPGWSSETERTLSHMWPKDRSAGVPAKASTDLGPVKASAEPDETLPLRDSFE